MKIIKEARGFNLNQLNKEVKEMGITPENFIEHNYFYVNSHDATHQILFWAEE